MDYQTNVVYVSGFLRSITNNNYNVTLTVIAMVCPGISQ